jgi:hypothetical protein
MTICTMWQPTRYEIPFSAEVSIHTSTQPYEYDSDYSPAWRYVARHMRWTQSLEELADKYVRATIGVEDDKPTPPVSATVDQGVQN